MRNLEGFQLFPPQVLTVPVEGVAIELPPNPGGVQRRPMDLVFLLQNAGEHVVYLVPRKTDFVGLGTLAPQYLHPVVAEGTTPISYGPYSQYHHQSWSLVRAVGEEEDAEATSEVTVVIAWKTGNS